MVVRSECKCLHKPLREVCGMVHVWGVEAPLEGSCLAWGSRRLLLPSLLLEAGGGFEGQKCRFAFVTSGLSSAGDKPLGAVQGWGLQEVSAWSSLGAQQPSSAWQSSEEVVQSTCLSCRLSSLLGNAPSLLAAHPPHLILGEGNPALPAPWHRCPAPPSSPALSTARWCMDPAACCRQATLLLLLFAAEAVARVLENSGVRRCGVVVWSVPAAIKG